MKLRRFLNLSKLIGGFVSIVGAGISLALTINLAVQVFSTGTSNDFWVALGVAVGTVFNLAEIGCFIRWKRNDEPAALVLGIVLGLVSVSASVGALQISLEKGAMQSTAYTQKLREIEFIDKQIDQYQGTANRQRDINYLTASGRTLDKATNLLEDRRQAQTELSTIQTQGAGLNAALYRAYAKLLGVEVMKIAIWLNICLSFLIEITFLYFTVVSVKAEETTTLETFDEKAIKTYLATLMNDNGGDGKTGNREPVQGQETPVRYKNDGEIKAENVRKPIGFRIGENITDSNKNLSPSENENDGKKFERSNEILSLSENKKFELSSNQELSPSSNEDFSLGENNNLELSENLDVSPSEKKKFEPSENRIPREVLTELKREFKRTGKSDKTIVYLWDQGERNKSEIGRLAGKILKGNRKKISPSYVCRILKQEKGV